MISVCSILLWIQHFFMKKSTYSRFIPETRGRIRFVNVLHQTIICDRSCVRSLRLILQLLRLAFLVPKFNRSRRPILDFKELKRSVTVNLQVGDDLNYTFVDWPQRVADLNLNRYGGYFPTSSLEEICLFSVWQQNLLILCSSAQSKYQSFIFNCVLTCTKITTRMLDTHTSTTGSSNKQQSYALLYHQTRSRSRSGRVKLYIKKMWVRHPRATSEAAVPPWSAPNSSVLHTSVDKGNFGAR